MFKIIAPYEEYTRVIAGVHFINGKAETENRNIAIWLEGRGFKVEKETEKQKPLSKMTVEELEKYAEDLGIDLSNCNIKDEKKTAIEAFLNRDNDKGEETEDVE